MMVTGTATPSSEKTRVMPSFRPMRPLVIASPNLDLDVHAGRQIELGQRIHGLGPGIVDVEQPLVGAELELLPALLVHVRAPQHRPPLHLDRERDGAGDLGAGLLDGADDIGRGLVEDDVVECLQANSDFAGHYVLLTRIADSGWRGADRGGIPALRFPLSASLFQDLGHDARAHGPPTFADREPQPVVHRHRGNSSIDIWMLSPGITISTPA